MTTVDSDRKYSNYAWLLVIGMTVFRVVYGASFPLVPDETNYWQWGRHLDWGYHDQSPMIGWTIRLFCELFGNTELAVRLPSILAMLIASGYLILIADRWFGGRAAFNTALLSQTVLLFNVGGVLATADGLQAAGWAAASYHVARGYEEDSLQQWILGGLWFGFGFLSKLTMIIFLPCAYLYGLLSAQHRRRLAVLKPYIGVLLGLLMFFPVVYWNAQNNWNFIRHVAYLGGANEGFTLHVKYLGEYFGSQAGLLSPLVFVMILMAWYTVIKRWRQPGHWMQQYLLCTSLPMIAIFAFLSLHTRVYGNWPGAGYLTATVLAAVLFGPDSGKKHNSVKLWFWTIATSTAITAIVLLQVVWPVLPLTTELDRTSTEIYGWKELGVKAHAVHTSMPRPEKTFYFGLRYQIASELAFYVPGQPETVSINKWKRPNVYDYWRKDEDLLGWDAVGFSYHENDFEPLQRIFEKVDPPERFEVFRTRPFMPEESRKPVQTFYLYRAYGFKGGLRWNPPRRDDIRVVK